MNIETFMIDTPEAFQQLQEYAKSFSVFAIDTETNHRKERLAQLWGIGFCFEEDRAFYIPFRDKFGNKLWSELLEKSIAYWVENISKEKKMLMHNGVYDILVLKYNLKIDLTDYLYCDTILLKHTIDEERPHGLKETSVKYLGPESDKAEEALKENVKANGGTYTKEQKDMYKADTEVLGEYCAWDTNLTFRLFNLFEPKLKEQELWDLFYKDEIMPLYREVTIPMKDKGFPIDFAYFTNLKIKINHEIDTLEEEIQKSIDTFTSDFSFSLLETEYPEKTTGNFPKRAAELYDIFLPEKNGKITLAKKEIENLYKNTNNPFYGWMLGVNSFPFSVYQVQKYSFFKDNPDSKHVFNLKSNKHLQHLFFTVLKETPLSKTEGGDPQVDDDFVESIKDKYEWVKLLIDYKKLIKLESTYISGILEEQINGVIYPSFLQFGTDSGRFSCRAPNLQNLPRVKEDDEPLSPLVLRYTNAIKRGFIAGEGNAIVNSDFSQLEPRAFSEACGDVLLQEVFKKGEDLYGFIAKEVWNLDCSANEVKKKYPKYRQVAKVIALAIVYGAEAGRISKLLGCSYQEAEDIIEMYLGKFSGLISYMEQCDKQVCKTGMIKTRFGRARHLSEAKNIYFKYGMKILDRRWSKNNGLSEMRWTFKNLLNLAKNFPIQGLAGHITNRSMLAIAREYKKRNLGFSIRAMVHDEITSIGPKDQALEAKEIVQDKMENTVKLTVPLKAEPLIADNWADAK